VGQVSYPVDSVGFCLPEISISLLSLKGILLNVDFLVDFFFHRFEYYATASGSLGFNEELAVHLTEAPWYVVSHVCLAALKIFSLSSALAH
jgi:hypothetical protein